MKKKLLVALSLVTMILFSANLYTQERGSSRIGFQLGGYLPLERWSDVVSNGIGVSVLYNHKIISTISITGTVGYYTFPSKHDVGEALESVGNISYVISPVLAGLRAGFVRDDQAFQPYLGFDLGVFLAIHQYKTSAGLNLTLPQGSSLFGFAPVIGFRLRLGLNVDLDINAKWNIAKDVNHLGLNLGVIFRN